MSEEIIIDSYKFRNFSLAGNTTIDFAVTPIEGRDVTEADSQTVREILEDLGKWESLIETGLHMLSDLRIIQIVQATLQSYEKPYGIELYEVNIRRAFEHLNCSIHTRPEERHRRENTGTAAISVEEIQGQVNNIPKWKAFKKTIQLVKEQLR
jgi:hypothetical protein